MPRSGYRQKNLPDVYQLTSEFLANQRKSKRLSKIEYNRMRNSVAEAAVDLAGGIYDPDIDEPIF